MNFNLFLEGEFPKGCQSFRETTRFLMGLTFFFLFVTHERKKKKGGGAAYSI